MNKGSNSEYVVHEKALCESQTIGAGTRIWAFAHILPGAKIGGDCNICDGVFIENDVRIGDRVTVKCGVQLWDGVVLEDDVFVGPNATFTNDLFPRSKARPAQFEPTLVHKGASIGANATLLAGVEIGQGAMVGAGSVVTRSVPPHAIVVGNPARIVGYVGVKKAASAPQRRPGETQASMLTTEVNNVTLHVMPHIRDMRGDLSVGEFERSVPFMPRRYFLVFDVPSREVRGAHAHRRCHQFLVCVKGECTVVADDGFKRREFVLNHPSLGIYLPPMTWAVQYKYSPESVLLVFASDYYAPDDYIRDYEEFLKFAKAQSRD